MDYLASMYIDNEMDLDQKRRFVEKVRSEPTFAEETLDLLDQEQSLRTLPGAPAVDLPSPRWRSFRFRMSRLMMPLGFTGAGFATALLVFMTILHPSAPSSCSNRFVLFAPTVSRVELAGSFTGWQRIAMQRAGTSGYWEIRLSVPSGEHRFTYILDGHRQMADPTFPASEKDDFGGENSILTVEDRV